MDRSSTFEARSARDLQTLTDDVAAPFSPDRFALSRLPVEVGHLPDAVLHRSYPCCLDMLVKLPGGELTVPDPYATDPAIEEFLSRCLEFEDTILPGWRRSRYLYLTVDRRIVRAGSTHRNGGWHFDGMQGSRYPEKLEACHQYVVSSTLTTEFSDSPTDALELDETKHNWFEHLGAQVPEGHAVHRADSHVIVLMSAYQLHRSPIAEEDAWRTFVRLDVSLKQQDRVGNTVNPDLAAPFDFQLRNLPEGLSRPIADAGWKDGRMFARATS